MFRHLKGLGDGLLLGAVAVKFVLPHSASFGLLLLGIATLLIGAAFGREER